MQVQELRKKGRCCVLRPFHSLLFFGNILIGPGRKAMPQPWEELIIVRYVQSRDGLVAVLLQLRRELRVVFWG